MTLRECNCRSAWIVFVVVVLAAFLGAGVMYTLMSYELIPGYTSPSLHFYSSTVVPENWTGESPKNNTTPPMVVKVTPASLPSSSTQTDNRLLAEMRLPRVAKPSRYELSLAVNLPNETTNNQGTFQGVVKIFFNNERSVKEIVLNQNQLTLKFVELKSEGGKKIIVTDVKTDNHLERVTFQLAEDLPPGSHILEIGFRGVMGPYNGHLGGLYTTSYKGHQGEKLYAAVTQLEPQDARRMVPCFDEPEYKAVWSVTIKHPKETIALGNQIEIHEETLGEWKWTTFADTPKMSSYLLAIAVSNYSYIETRTKRGIRFRVYTPPGDLKSATWALEAGSICLDGFEKKYKIPLPLNKTDMILVPDFEAGAMENWGLITYRPGAILYNPQVDSFAQKLRVAEVIAHELAHQWFGNLVTMKFWDNLYLNEGFATFVEVLGLDIISKGFYEAEYLRLTDAMPTAMKEDSLTSTGHPLVYELRERREIEDMFSSITYQKGSLFIEMIRQVLGNETFNQGIENYLMKYSYKNTEQIDLFRELDAVVPANKQGPNGKRFNVTEFGLRWTLQKGFPVITLIPQNATHAEIVQKRFVIDNGEEKPQFKNNPYGYKWDVPIWLKRGVNPISEFHWLPANGQLIVPYGEETIVLNDGSFAYARTNYTYEGWRRIIDQLKKNHTIFSQRTRYRILNDLFEEAKLGKGNWSLAIEATSYINKETDSVAFEPFFLLLEGLVPLFGRKDGTLTEQFVSAILGVYKKTNITKVLDAMQKNEQSFLYWMGQVDRFMLYCQFAMKDCAAILKYNFFIKQFLDRCQGGQKASECSTVPIAIRREVYCAGVYQESDKISQMMLEMIEKENQEAELNRLYWGISCSSSKPAIYKALDSIASKKGVHPLWIKKVIGRMVSGSTGDSIALEYLSDKLKEVVNGTTKNIYVNIIDALTVTIKDRAALKEFEDRMGSISALRSYPNLAKKIKIAYKRAEKRIKFVESPQGQILVRALKQQIKKFIQ